MRRDHPYARVAIAAVYNTKQARVLEGHDSLSIALEAVHGVLDAAGASVDEVDAVFGQFGAELTYLLSLGPAATPFSGGGGIAAVMSAASAIARGDCTMAVVAGGGAGEYRDRTATAPWTRPANEFVVPFGMYTAMEFALLARRHMETYGTKPDDFHAVAAIIRNNGHVNPEAVYTGRGPYTVDDIRESRMVADPFRLLDCSMTAEGGAALLLTTVERARDLRQRPVRILGAGIDRFGPAYQHPPRWDLTGRDGTPNGWVGRRAAQHAFATAGLRPDDVDVCEFYDPFSFEVLRQFEAFGFCEPGEGAAFIADGNASPGGRFPVTTDGGLLSFSHGGATVQLLQRVIRAVQQLQGTCISNQVEGAEVAMCSNGGPGALFTDVMLLGVDS